MSGAFAGGIAIASTGAMALPKERAHGLVIAIAVVMALAVPRIRLRLSVPAASRRTRSLAWRLWMWKR